VEGTSHAVVAIVLRGHDEIGSTFLTVLEHYAKVLQDHDSKLLLVGVNPAVFDQLAKTRVLTLIGEENVFQATSQLGAALNQAVAAANAWLGQRTPGSGLKPA
jgi:sulfate permease, SulP family